jgi:Transcriptional regulator, AbiEi antitoxin
MRPKGIIGSEEPAVREVGHGVAELARRQHGVVSRHQLFELGLTAAEMRSLIRRGHLQRLHQGVYAVGYRRADRHSRWMAAVLASGADAVLSHLSAAQLWGISPAGELESEVTRPRRGKARGEIKAHIATLPADEVDVVREIPVTGVFRTVFDLAALVSVREMRFRQLERAFHEAEAKGLTGRVSLPGLIERYPGHRGVGVLRKLLGRREPVGVTESELEERFLAFLDARGFPRPRLNATLPVRGRLLRPDCMWERERLIAELDGRGAHRGDAAFERDRRRDRELLVGGGGRCG